MTNQSPRARDLTDSRHLLLSRRRDLRERLARLDSDRRRESQSLSPDFAEQAAERENDEVVDALHQRTRAELHAVEQALARIDCGGYGLCTHCGEPIESQRLAAVPHASRCGHCADIDAPRA